MKLSDIILEMPYEMDGSLKPEKGLMLSQKSLNSEFKQIGQKVFESNSKINLINFWASDIRHQVVGVFPDKDEFGRDSNLVIFNLDFKDTPTVKNTPSEISNFKQVDKVWCHPKYKGYGFSTFVYMLLAKFGIPVVSDSVQFPDGKALWKKISSVSDFQNLKVKILDDENGFIQKDGVDLVYDGNNLDDMEIWSKDEYYHGYHLLLVLLKE